jgi:two-component system NtrC family sensor kinase
MKKSKTNKKESFSKNPKSQIVELKRRIMILENLRKRRIQKNAANSGELKLLAMGISHEFNNILGAVDGHAEWALESGNSADWKSSLEMIRLACERSSEITSALRGWGQPKEEQKSLFAMDETLNELKSLLKGQLQGSGVQLKVQSCPVRIYGNRTEILEVILNLVKNSMEAITNAKSSVKEISISHILKKHEVHVSVVDSGPGIPEIYREKIFEPFFTMKGALSHLQSGDNVAPAKSRNGEGTGLGLFLSRSIVEEHGGNLSLQDSEFGTHFKISLPLTET